MHMPEEHTMGPCTLHRLVVSVLHVDPSHVLVRRIGTIAHPHSLDGTCTAVRIDVAAKPASRNDLTQAIYFRAA